jgi:ParB/RepB/Spo0J family partition protein
LESQILEVDLSLLEPMEDMRLEHDEATDQEFLEEIREHGVRDPLDCRTHPSKPGMYEVVDGRRRLRAARILGLTRLRINLSEMDDVTAYSIAFSKNHHRASTSNIEDALWLRHMKTKLNLTNEVIATRVAKSRQWVNNQILYAEDFTKASEPERTMMKTEYQARQLRQMPSEKKQEILAKASTGFGPQSGREMERKMEATMTDREVLETYRYQPDEFILYTLQEEAGCTASEARDLLIKFKAKQLPWQQQPKQTEFPKGDYVPPPDDPTVKLYAELGKFYPLELIDIVSAVKPAKTLPTWQSNMIFYIRKMLSKATPELKQSVMEEFTK